MEEKFIGREYELSQLESRYSNDDFEFVAIYGRRRVGKTTLITEFTKGKKTISFQAVNASISDNLRAMSAAVSSYEGRPSGLSFGHIDDALHYIFDLASEEKIIFVIDEYPYLAESYPPVSSLLQAIIDRSQSSKMFLILCGSSNSFMESQVLGDKSPLYGRATGKMRMEPFDYLESGKFVDNYDSADRLSAYGMVGGIPQFLKKINDSRSLKDNLESLVHRDSMMYDAIENMMNMEFRKPAVYNSIIASIANGNRRVRDISTSMGMESNDITAYLAQLVEVGIIGKERPINTDSKKSAVYYIRDNLISFWFGCVRDSVSDIIAGDTEGACEDILRRFQTRMGYVFEDACRTYISKSTKFHDVGRWWGSDTKNRTQVEIDIVGTRKINGRTVGLFGECKYRNEPMDVDVLESLLYESELVSGFDSKEYVLFSKSGFTQRLKSRAEETGVELATLDDLYGK
ncbi:MAG: ATP-binding protein [Candidatus Methanoplasma sp.]|jgi:AAA+ ATPase superfamily predicted ATPase|nr:ATP-binding protein [Candidatus Methanoplasma sp.]